MLKKYLEINVTYDILTPLRLPDYPGFMIRGILGEELKKISCVFRNNPLKAKCKKCKFIKTCPYGYLYELGKDNERCIMYSTPPIRPWSLKINRGGVYDVNEVFNFSIYVFDKQPWYIGMLKRALEKIEVIGRDRNRGFGKLKIRDIKVIEHKFERYKYLKRNVLIRFLTPTHIVKDGVIDVNPSLYDLIINGGRRYYLIREIYYKEKGLINRLPLLNELKDISLIKYRNIYKKDIIRWSEKKRTKQLFSGIEGKITFEFIRKPSLKIKNMIEEIIAFSNIYGLGKRVTTGMGNVKISSYA